MNPFNHFKEITVRRFTKKFRLKSLQNPYLQLERETEDIFLTLSYKSKN